MHRLNRTEYGNAVRDLLALDVDVHQLLPSDGADFGFDNIAAVAQDVAAAARTLSDRRAAHQRAGGRRSRRCRRAPPSIRISREFTQSGYIEGLPLGTRGGTVVRHVFPADGEYKLSGRLVRGVEEGYAGVEGNDLPHTFVITVDGAEVYSAQIGGLKDHEVQARDMNEARAIIDARMTGTRARHRRSARRRASPGASGRPSGRTCGSRRAATARKSIMIARPAAAEDGDASKARTR